MVTSYFSVFMSVRVNRSTQVELLGMRKAAVAEPEFLVEPSRIDDERIALPLGLGRCRNRADWCRCRQARLPGDARRCR